MFCEKCGAKMPDNVRLCPECGAPVAAIAQSSPPPAPPAQTHVPPSPPQVTQNTAPMPSVQPVPPPVSPLPPVAGCPPQGGARPAGGISKKMACVIGIAVLLLLLAGGGIWYATRDTVNTILGGPNVPVAKHEETAPQEATPESDEIKVREYLEHVKPLIDERNETLNQGIEKYGIASYEGLQIYEEAENKYLQAMLDLEAPAAASKFVELNKERAKLAAEHISIGRAWLDGERNTEDTLKILERVQNELDAKGEEISEFMKAHTQEQ